MKKKPETDVASQYPIEKMRLTSTYGITDLRSQFPVRKMQASSTYGKHPSKYFGGRIEPMPKRER